MTNKFDALIASANRSAARQIKEDLKRQMQSLTAAVSTGRQFDRAQQVASDIGPAVEQLYDRWGATDFARTAGNLQKFSDELTQAINADLNNYTDAVARSLRSRGLLTGLSQDQIDQLTSDAAAFATSPEAVRDLFVRLHGATDDTLGRYTGEANAFNRSTHVALNASDKLTQDVADLQTENGVLTGRRMWQANDEDSRNANLDGVIADDGEPFTVQTDTGETEDVMAPRPVGGDPGDWSNEKSALLFETAEGAFI